MYEANSDQLFTVYYRNHLKEGKLCTLCIKRISTKCLVSYFSSKSPDNKNYKVVFCIQRARKRGADIYGNHC